MERNLNLEEIEFTIFDTETTGLEPESGDRIVEIAGIRCRDKLKLATFQSLINPGRGISQAAFEVNRITTDMLKDAPKIDEVLPRFLGFIQGSFLCSYNATFDITFLNNELKLMGRGPLRNMMVIDLLKMAKWLLPGLDRYALWFVADKLGIKCKQDHRALSDAQLSLAVFAKLQEILEKKGISDFMSFFSLCGLNVEFLNNLYNQRIAKIQEAMDLGVKLMIKYISRSDAGVTLREVIPKEIRQEKNHSYLVGYCCLRQQERTFRIDGILHLEIV